VNAQHPLRAPEHVPPVPAGTADGGTDVAAPPGHLGATRPLFERAQSIYEAAYGRDHPEVAAGLNNLAAVLGDLGEPASARPLAERALSIDIEQPAHVPEDGDPPGGAS
jgi:hypothetical protein